MKLILSACPYRSQVKMSKIKIRCWTKAAWVWETDEVEVNVMLHGLKKTNGRKYFVCSGEAYIPIFHENKAHMIIKPALIYQTVEEL